MYHRAREDPRCCFFETRIEFGMDFCFGIEVEVKVESGIKTGIEKAGFLQ